MWNVYRYKVNVRENNRAIKNGQARTTGNNGDRTQSKRVNVRENNRAIKNRQARTTGNNGDRTQSKSKQNKKHYTSKKMSNKDSKKKKMEVNLGAHEGKEDPVSHWS